MQDELSARDKKDPRARQCLLGILRDEGVGLGPQRHRRHAPRPLTRDFDQWVLHRSELSAWAGNGRRYIVDQLVEHAVRDRKAIEDGYLTPF